MKTEGAHSNNVLCIMNTLFQHMYLHKIHLVQGLPVSTITHSFLHRFQLTSLNCGVERPCQKRRRTVGEFLPGCLQLASVEINMAYTRGGQLAARGSIQEIRSNKKFPPIYHSKR